MTVIRPPRVERIDLHYEYPAAFRMAPREEEDGGDIYGPAGTRVRVTVHADKPVTQRCAQHHRRLRGGAGAGGDALQGVLSIGEDGSYRVALADADGLSNPGDTEYFIRTLQDRPPDVRIVRPASDRQVTPVEEVAIEAKADDDFGVAALDLVYTIGSGAEKVVPFEREGEPTAVSGRRTVYLEDLPRQAGRLRRVLRARARRQPRQAIDRGPQRHLLPGSHAVRRRVRRVAEPGQRLGRRFGRPRGSDPAAERHHHRDVEPRPAQSSSRAAGLTTTSARSPGRSVSCARRR